MTNDPKETKAPSNVTPLRPDLGVPLPDISQECQTTLCEALRDLAAEGKQVTGTISVIFYTDQNGARMVIPSWYLDADIHQHAADSIAMASIVLQRDALS